MSRAAEEPEDDEDALNQLEARRATLDCLAAGEAAGMLAALPASEASQLLLLIGEEKRTAALGAMSAQARAALAAAMPADTAEALGLTSNDKDGSGSSTSEEAEETSSVPKPGPVETEASDEVASSNVGSAEEGEAKPPVDKEADTDVDGSSGRRSDELQGVKEQCSEAEVHGTPSVQPPTPAEIHSSQDCGQDVRKGGEDSLVAESPASTGPPEGGNVAVESEADAGEKPHAGQQDEADHAQVHAPEVAAAQGGSGDDEEDDDAVEQLEARRATLACLSSAEAATMLEGLPPVDAAQLVMLMGAEARSAALRLMSVGARSAVRSALPSEEAAALELGEEEDAPSSDMPFSPPPRAGAEAEDGSVSAEPAAEHVETFQYGAGAELSGAADAPEAQSGADSPRTPVRRKEDDGEELAVDIDAPAGGAGGPQRAASGPDIEAWVVSGQRAVQGPEISVSPQGVAHFAMEEEEDDGDLMDQMPSPLHHEYTGERARGLDGPQGDSSPASLSRGSSNGSLPSSDWVKDRVSKTVEWSTNSKIGTQAKGAAETAAVKARQGFAQAADSDAAKKAKGAAVIARQGLTQAADKAAPKVAEFGGKAMDAAGTAAEKASRATEGVRSEAKHKAEAAADKAKVGLAQVSKGLMGFVRKPQAKAPPPS